MRKKTTTIFRRKLLITLISTLLFSVQIFGQATRTEIIGAYTYNFAKHAKVRKCNNKKTYNISLFTENQELINEFRKIEDGRKIDGKKVFLSILKEPNEDYSGSCLVFIASDKIEYYTEVFNKTQGKGILIVSENYTDKRKIMLNLYDTEDGKVLFEINKSRLYERQIGISDELLLMGGTDIDVAKLYLESQEKLNRSEKELKEMQARIQALNSQFIETQEKTNLQQNRIKEQIKLIEDYEKKQNILLSEISEQQKKLSTHQYQINKQKKLLSHEKGKLVELKDRLNKSKKVLDIQKNELNEGMHKLKVLKDEIRIKSREVKVQDVTLGEQYDIINKQRQVNRLFIIIIVLVIALAIVLLIYGIQRKRKNEILNEQKEEITAKNQTIEEHLLKEKQINEDLEDKNEELTSLIEQLKNTQQQLIQSEKMASLGVLTAGIAHEINNPINFVYTGINSLKKDFDDVEVIINKMKELDSNDENLKEKIDEIDALKKELYFDEAVEAIPQTMTDISIGANRTAEIVGGLRKFSRMGENKFVLSNIHEYIQAALMMLKNKYKNKVKITRNFDTNLPEIYCNPGKITQVFMNLIFNGIDAINEKGEADGEIIITTSSEKKTMIISIKDNGTGIDKDLVKKIFDPFFTTKDVGKGTGLGLAITYGIIEEHKGEIEVISEIGSGTEFIIQIPKEIKNEKK